MASEILEGLLKAVTLILSRDPTLIEITLRSLAVSGLATLLASLWSMPIGVLVGLGKFRGRSILRSLFNALLGLPTVTLGLLLYLVFSRSGPLGSLHILYTPAAIVLGQALLVTPIMVSFLANALEAVDPEIKSLALTLGASEMRARLTVLSESLDGVFLAVTASFNRAIAELGVALMIGGNIKGVTRILTTFIALETGRGEIALSMAFAFVLLAMVTAVNLSVNLVKGRL
ncbi:MAG: ABC transporter permease [Candidatus Bathyarchaeota archaeon]|jgi:tungstate transport system permease protein|nr:ABC transporter permease [Candidatus Bathyarchaeota archaeon]